MSYDLTLLALEKQIDRLNTTAADQPSEGVDQCLAGIDQLSHDVKDASAVLPAYDQRTYSQVRLYLHFNPGLELTVAAHQGPL